MAHLTRADFSFGIRGLLSATNSRETEECEAGGLSEDGLGRQALKIDLLPFRSIVALNDLRLAEVPHSRNFGFEQEFSCGILANRCYAYVPTCLAGISFGTRIEIFN